MSCSNESLYSVQCDVDFVLKTEIKSEPQEEVVNSDIIYGSEAATCMLKQEDAEDEAQEAQQVFTTIESHYIKEEYNDSDSESGLLDTEHEVGEIKEKPRLKLKSELQPEFVTDDKSSDNRISGEQNSMASDVSDSDSDGEEEKEVTDLPNFRKMQTTPIIIKNGEEKYYSCRKCDEKFLRKCSWKSHFYATHKPHSCTQCKESFTQKANLIRHMQIHTGNKPYVCMECCKSFTQKGHLKRHMYIHSGYKPFSCELCDKSFHQKTSLENHILLHAGLRPFSCHECGKSFTQKRHLRTHLSTHSTNKYYFCTQCRRNFSQKSEFENHINNDMGCKPFTCDICHKSFLLKRYLKNHVLNSHAPEKKYICTVCGKAFSRKSHLQRHMYTHDGYNPWSCPVCFKKFHEKCTLNNHMCIHTSEKLLEYKVPNEQDESTWKTTCSSSEKQCEKLFYCQKCDKSYSWREYSINHMKVHLNDHS